MNSDYDDTLELELANDVSYDEDLDDLLWGDDDLYKMLGFGAEQLGFPSDADRLAA
jgi:hypothetical protein